MTLQNLECIRRKILIMTKFFSLKISLITSHVKKLKSIHFVWYIYCKWHKSFFSGWSKEKFLTVMRYALPQRKIILEPKLPDEKQLAEELFGSEKVKNLSTLVSPKSLPILCHRKDEGFAC